MSSEQFQAAYESIYSTGTRLLQYLREIEEGRRSEGNNSEGLHSIEDELNKALLALQEQKYQVAVIAAMKAGKSTFLNAMIGADILASESEACTVCRTDVRLLEAGQVPRLLEYQEGQRKPILISEGDTGKIRQEFLKRTRAIRENNNSDNTTRFELWHSIDAISKYSSLAGFTLVDTPGPNEWQAAGFNTVALKQAALEALRTCNAILFVLDYSSFKDNTNSELFEDLINQRQEFLAENTGKIYFILNKVDRKSEKDREIADVVEDLKKTLIDFGIPEPIIYPVSAWQGLLAKLIQQGTATDSQDEDFFKFFAARYAEKDERGRRYIPASDEIAPQALIDSGIPTVEDTVIQTIIQNSGWNLLNDVLAKLDKVAKATEDSLNLQIKGWDLEINALKIKVEEYRRRAASAKEKVQAVKKSVKGQEQILTNGFSQGISLFAEGAKGRIQYEIDRIAQSRTDSSVEFTQSLMQPSVDIDWGQIGELVGELGGGIIELLPGGKSLGKILRRSAKATGSLLDTIKNSFPKVIESKISDPYKLRVKTEEEAQQIGRTINEFCSPLIQNWWLDTQDKLVREGSQIREILVQRIQEDIQQISNELSDYLGEALQVELNINPIQFPDFEFKGIDAQIQEQQKIYKRLKTKTHCCSNESYEVEAKVDSKRSFYEVDLGETSELIKQKIDEQVRRNLGLLQQVIKKQVSDDFTSAEKQIDDYIKRFQDELDGLLNKREMKEAEGDQIRAKLEAQKTALNEYLSDLTSIRESLNTWKPM
jgi:GTPase Era involved in 16S rRNA processing